MPRKEERQTLYLIQIYRGLAALMVVGYHASLLLLEKNNFYGLGGVLSWGFSGVHLFFVLSGFVICFIHFDDISEPRQAGSYLYKRFARIYPTYWVVLLVFLPSFLLGVSHVNGYFLVDNLTLFRVSNHDKIVVVAWTLSHEVLFYVVFLSLIINRFFGSGVILIWGFLISYQISVGQTLMPPFALSRITGIDYGAFANLFRLASNPINLLFALGAIAYAVTRLLRLHPERERIALASIGIGLAVFIFSCGYWLTSELDYTKWDSFDAAFGISAFFLIAGSTSSVMNAWASGRRVLLLLGSASYSIYLIHFGLQDFFITLVGHYPFFDLNIVFLFMIFFSVLSGLLLNRTVESPLLGYFGRRQTVTLPKGD